MMSMRPPRPLRSTSSPHGPTAPRAGLTLPEMLTAMTLMVIVFALAVPFFRAQSRTVSTTAGRFDALQNARFAQSAIDKDLRIAGLGVVSQQPLIVQADNYAITFNADLVTHDPNDPSAIYYDPDVDTMATTSMQASTPVYLPRSVRQYPDTNYFANQMPSRAETISYWVSPDSTAGRSDVYVLWRRVNNTAPEVVTRGIYIPVGQPFFRYYKVGSAGIDTLPIPSSSLPLFHTAAIHGAPNDTGKLAWVDSIRVVRIRATALYHDPSRGDVVRTVETSTKLINAGMVRTTVCGEPPLPASGLTATPLPNPAAPTRVRLAWTASVDQDAGEKDVERYLVFKRAAGGGGTWVGEPIADIAAGQPNYTLDDTQLASGSWEYAVFAQDCSPTNSEASVSSAVTIP